MAKPEAAVCDDRFAELVLRRSRFVFRVAYAIVRNTHDAEDVVQETFLRLYRARTWENVDDEQAFLARIAWRAAVNHTRTRRKTAMPDPESPSSGATPEESVIADDWKRAFHRLVDALPEDLRQPLALSTVEELNSRQIAHVMGIPEGTVRSRLFQARQILKQKAASWKGGPL